MVSARPEAHVTLPDSHSDRPGHCRGAAPGATQAAAPALPRRRSPALPRRPSQLPAAEDVRVDVRHLLPGIRAVVEDGAIAGAFDALGHRDLVRETGHLLEQAALGLGAGVGDGREVDVMFFRYDQHMRGRLRVDIAERDSP